MDHEPNAGERGSLPFIVAVCVIAALGGLLFGYDTGVISGAIGPLKAHFGLDSSQEGWAGACVLLGCMAGVAVAGVASDRLGRKKTLILSGILFLASSIGTALPEDFSVFVVFRILAGVGIGFASMASPMYIAEITPARIRGRMVSVNQFAIISGMLLIYFVNYLIARSGDEAWRNETSWRWMFASGALPSFLFLALLLAVPESPRWLVERGRRDEARRILERIGGPRAAAAEMEAIESSLAGGPGAGGNLGEVFRPGLRKVLGIAIALAVLQQITGINVFLYFAPKIFGSIGGANFDAALLEQVVVGAVNLSFTVLAIWTVDRLGRKPLMLIGSAGMGICLAAMGATAHFEIGAGIWLLPFILGYIACFALSVGPVTWVILSEIFPTSIRGRALGVATFFLWLADFIVTQTYPMMQAEDGWLMREYHGGIPFYIYAAFCAVLLAVMVRWVPETKGKSLEEIEASWKGRAPAGSAGPAAR